MPHMPGFGSWVLIALIGVLFFGKRLPEVGKSVAGAIVNFKKGLKEAQEEITNADTTTRTLPSQEQTTVTSMPNDAKFDPYTGQPVSKPKFDPYTGKPVTDDSHSETHETVA